MFLFYFIIITFWSRVNLRAITANPKDNKIIGKSHDVVANGS